MNLEEAMIVWTPARGVFETAPTAGQIAITKIPQSPHLKAHPMSAGACDRSWREATEARRRDLLQRYFTQIIHRDRLDEAVVRQALGVIEDVDSRGLSAKAPRDGDAWL